MQGIAIVASIIAVFMGVALVLNLRAGTHWRELYEMSQRNLADARDEFFDALDRAHAQNSALREDNRLLRETVAGLTTKTTLPVSSDPRNGPPSTIVRTGPAPETRPAETRRDDPPPADSTPILMGALVGAMVGSAVSRSDPAPAYEAPSYSSSSSSDSYSSSSSGDSGGGGGGE